MAVVEGEAVELVLEFEVDRDKTGAVYETKGTFRFAEHVEGIDEPLVGKLYVRKAGLRRLGFESAQDVQQGIEVTIRPRPLS